MTLKTQLIRFAIFLLFMTIIGMMVGPVLAGGDDIIQSNDQNLQTTGDVDTVIDTGGNKSIALVAPGLGDVDIAQCLGSEAWTLLVGGKQKLVLNQVCMAEFYLKQGRYDLAAQSLCNQDEIRKEYDTELACEEAHDFTPIIPEHDVHERSDEFARTHAMQEEEIEYLQEEQASLVGRLDMLTSQMEQAPAQAPSPTPIYVQQEAQEQYTDEDRAYILGLYTKGEDEDE